MHNDSCRKLSYTYPLYRGMLPEFLQNLRHVPSLLNGYRLRTFHYNHTSVKVAFECRLFECDGDSNGFVNNPDSFIKHYNYINECNVI